MGLLNQLASSEKTGGKVNIQAEAKQYYSENRRLVSQPLSMYKLL